MGALQDPPKSTQLPFTIRVPGQRIQIKLRLHVDRIFRTTVPAQIELGGTLGGRSSGNGDLMRRATVWNLEEGRESFWEGRLDAEGDRMELGGREEVVLGRET